MEMFSESTSVSTFKWVRGGFHRRIEDAGLDFEDVSGLTMLSIISTSLELYGSLFAFLFILYVIGRRFYVRAYNVLGLDDNLKTPLSVNYHGILSWVWGVFQPGDDELFEHCGLDAVVFVRSLRFGLRVALVGIANTAYLIPVYYKGGVGNTELEAITLGNITEGGHSLIAASVAAYVLFGSALYLIYKEFEWFTEYRHKFLARARPDNYTVFVKNIPPEIRTNDALMEYFQQVFSYEAVIDARIALDIPDLEKLVGDREVLAAKLEHAINILNVKGKRPVHNVINLNKKICTRKVSETVDSIDTWTEELEALNDQISRTIEKIQEENNPDKHSFHHDLEAALMRSEVYQAAQIEKKVLDAATHSSVDSNSLKDHSFVPATAGGSIEGTMLEAGPLLIDENDSSGDVGEKGHVEESFVEEDVLSENEENMEAYNYKGNNGISSVLSKAPLGALIGSADTLKASAGNFVSVARSAANAATSLLLGDEDGKPRDAGFVSFSSLKVKATALQMIHDPTPFTMTVQEAPLPKDIFWGNVGLAHRTQQIGMVIGNALTVLLCVFWTIPVTFLTGLGEVDKLKKMLPFLEDWIIKMPWIEMFLSQLKPLILVIIVGLLPSILTAFSKKEGHISETTLKASLFSKLSVFLLVQIFFVQMISGTLLSELQTIAENPLSIITTLGEALPKQAQSFVQYVIVKTCLNLGLEILRVSPIVTAWVRSLFGPNLTEAEKEKAWMGLSPLCEAPEFDFADVQANLILYYMITFVYSTLAPITAVIMTFAFLLLSLCYRNQLIYIYTPLNDTGGQFFTRFTNHVMVCIITAEITMFGVLTLKKGTIAAPMIVPLIVVTVLFNMYLKQEHYHVTKHLPSKMCVRQDLKNMGEIDFDFVKGKYLQPALQTKILVPENMPRADDTPDPMVFFTPEHSQVENETEENQLPRAT